MTAEEMVAELRRWMIMNESLSIGPGVGDYLFEDTLTGSNSHPIRDAIVRAYPHFDGVTDFTDCQGQCSTDNAGNYHLHLDAGTYVRRVWKNGTVILDDMITVVPPEVG